LRNWGAPHRRPGGKLQRKRERRMVSNYIVQVDGHAMGVQSCGKNRDWANVFFVESNKITTYCEVELPSLKMEDQRWFPWGMSKERFAELLLKHKDELMALVERLTQ